MDRPRAKGFDQCSGILAEAVHVITAFRNFRMALPAVIVGDHPVAVLKITDLFVKQEPAPQQAMGKYDRLRPFAVNFIVIMAIADT